MILDIWKKICKINRNLTIEYLVEVNSDADTDLQENIRYISSKMALYIRAMMDSGEYNECDYGMVIDIFQLLPQHFIQYIDSCLCDIYYFGTSEVTPEERYELLRKDNNFNKKVPDIRECNQGEKVNYDSPSYIEAVRWSDFKNNYDRYIEKACER